MLLVLVVALLNAGCTSATHDAASSTASGPAPSPPPTSSAAPTPQPAPVLTRVGGLYVGAARLVRTDVKGVSRHPQRIRWILRPRCPSGACALRLVSKSGGYSVLLRRHGRRYTGTTARPGFFTCAGAPEAVVLRVVLTPVASARVAGAWIVSRLVATLRNVSVPTPRCRRSFLVTTVVARRR
jgi:hypothetical protein